MALPVSSPPIALSAIGAFLTARTRLGPVLLLGLVETVAFKVNAEVPENIGPVQDDAFEAGQRGSSVGLGGAPADPALPPPPPRRSFGKPRSTPGMRVAAPQGSAPAPAGFVHDGFYLRFGLGGSYGRTFVRTDLVSQPDVGITGFGGAFDIWAGWTVSPGLVLGPALSVASQRSDQATVGAGPKSAASANQLLAGAFLDAYPNPLHGAHFGGLLALSGLRQKTDDGNSQTAFEGGGVGIQVFAGFDAWLAREWCLGGLLRLGGSVTQAQQMVSGQSVNKQGTSYSLSLLATILHH